MKTFNFLFAILIMVGVITGCAKDDNGVEEETGKDYGTLTIKGMNYDLVEGVIYTGMETSGPPYGFDIDLLTEVTSNGTLNLVALEMYSATEDDLQSGTYNYDIGGTSQAGTFSGIILMDMNKVTEESSHGYIVKLGTVLVNKSDSEYDITTNLNADKYEYDAVEDDWVVTESDVVITSYYKGSLRKDVH